MSLVDLVPPAPESVLAKNGYALLSDLEDPGYAEVIRPMEEFQLSFLAKTRALWTPSFPIPGDALAHFSRQWEYPYVWANVVRDGRRGRLLDAGSGITFFPFMLAAAGFDVDCCDGNDDLDLTTRFERASDLTGLRPRFTTTQLSEMAYRRAPFDVVVCVSVLEHVAPAARLEMVEALAAATRPGGRLVLTCDLDLGRNDGMLLEDVAELVSNLRRWFDPAYPLDLRRPLELLTSDYFLDEGRWRLPPPWQAHTARSEGKSHPSGHNAHFRTLAILGITAERNSRG
jgi:SAM-dependent methyltransferase